MKSRLVVACIAFFCIAWAGNPLGAEEPPEFLETLEIGKQCVTLTFEGIPSLERILYPPELGLTFEDKAEEMWRVIDTHGWGIENNPSGFTVAIWWITDPHIWPTWPWSADIAFDEPVSTASLYYASFFDITIEAFDADGNLLESISGPMNVDLVLGFNTWDFLDIERYANEIASVRITGGATATMLDDFKFCHILTPQAICQALIDKIEGLFVDGDLTQHQSDALIRKLNQIVKSLDRGKGRAAEMMVKVFVKQVNRFVRMEILSVEEGQFLIENVGAIEF